MAELDAGSGTPGLDDAALFNEVTSGTEPQLEPREGQQPPQEPASPAQPTQPAQPPAEPKPASPASPAPPAAAPTHVQSSQPVQPGEADATVPTARLREEADARRAAEKRVDALQTQVEALLARLPQPTAPSPPKRTDFLDSPSAFVQEELQPIVLPLQQQLVATREFYSQRDAVREFGAEKVQAAFAAVEQGLRNRDPEVHATYVRIMRTMDPYGEMVRWHQQRQTFAAVGGDINAYNQRILDQAMSDPAFQARVIEAARKAAAASGATVAQPAGGQPRAPNGQFAPATEAPSLPSIARVGAAALDNGQEVEQPSDEQLFADTTRRRRGTA